MPSNHRGRPSPRPPAARRLVLRQTWRRPKAWLGSSLVPCLPAAAGDRSRGSSVGQPRRWENQMVLNLLLPPPPPTHPPIHPSILSLQARGLAAFRRDLAGITPGKGLPLSKGHHPERGARVGPGASHS